MPDYSNDTYLRSLEESSADIRRQVTNSIEEINKQRQVAGQQTAQLPGVAANIYGGGSDRLTSDLASISGVNRTTGAQRVNVLPAVQQAFADGTASYGRVAGLLNQGFDEQAAGRRATVESVLAQLLADNESKRATYAGGREAEDRDRNFAREEAERRAALERELQDRDAALARELLELERSGTGYLPPPGNSYLPPTLFRPRSLNDRIL